MDRSRRGGTARAAVPAVPPPPASSRLTVRPNRRRPPTVERKPLWARLPKPAQAADACGRALRRSLPALAGVAVLGVVGGTAWAGYQFVTTSPRFAIEDIAIRGNHHLTSDQIRATLPVAVGDNVFAADLDTLVREV